MGARGSGWSCSRCVTVVDVGEQERDLGQRGRCGAPTCRGGRKSEITSVMKNMWAKVYTAGTVGGWDHLWVYVGG
jgi:hypothetical protein